MAQNGNGREEAKIYFAVFSELTQEGLESSRKFFEENGNLINYREIYFSGNFHRLKEILSKDSFSQKEFELFEYDRPNDFNDDVFYMIIHLRYVWDIISLGKIQAKLAKLVKKYVDPDGFELEFELLRLIDEAIKLYGLTEEERSIFHIADHRDDEDRMLEFIRNFKQTAWEREILLEVLSSLLVGEKNIFEAMKTALIDEKYKDSEGVIDNYSYPEPVQESVIKSVTLKKNFFKNLEELVKESRKIVENPNKDIK